MHYNIKDDFQTSLADRQVGPLIRTQEGAMDLGERGGAGVTPGLFPLFLVLNSIVVSRFTPSDIKVQITTLMLISVNHSTESDQSDTEGPPRHQRRLPALSRSTRNNKKDEETSKAKVTCEFNQCQCQEEIVERDLPLDKCTSPTVAEGEQPGNEKPRYLILI